MTYAASEDYLQNHASELTRFLRAVTEGIAYAEANPEKAVEIVMKYAGSETDPAHMQYITPLQKGGFTTERTEFFCGFGMVQAESMRILYFRSVFSVVSGLGVFHVCLRPSAGK